MKNLPVKLQYFFACILGALLTFGYAPFGIWFITLVCLPLIIYLLNTIPKQDSFKFGLAFGLGWFGAGISWVHVSIADFGGIPLIASLGLMLLLCSYLAIFPATAFYIIKRFFAIHTWPLAFPLIWLLVEWLRSWLLTGFPWLSLGYSQISSPLGGWMPIIGEFGVSALVIVVSASFALSIHSKNWRASSLLGLIVFIAGYTFNQIPWTQYTGKTVKMAMVQGNIKQEMRWAPEHDQPTMDKYLNMTAEHWLGNDVIIWPEAAIPQLEPIALDYLHKIDSLAANTKTGLITGIVNYNFDTREAYNNLIGLGLKYLPSENKSMSDHQGQYHYLHGNRFAKHHLLPIGEFIPFENWLRGLAPIFDLPMSSFNRGAYKQANLQLKGLHFAPAICFEIAFPRQIAANLYFNTNFIITVSNDAWFGRSHGPAQHLEIAQVRAKEFGLPVLRATNNGITAFIDHQGNIQSHLPQFEAAVLSDEIAIVSGKTPYRKWGDWPTWGLCLLMFSFALLKMKNSA